MTILPVIWLAIVAFVIMMYVLLDGFDLGIGILFPFVKEEQHRCIMIETIGPVWDGNETWLVLGGALLYGAFPVVYSTLLPTLYMPIMLMLAALVLRGVTFEFRHKSTQYRHLWSGIFFFASLVATFCQGVVLGTVVQGYGVEPVQGAVPFYDWLTPFSCFTGAALVLGYALLGACWLIGKTEGELQARMYPVAQTLLGCMAGAMLIVSYWTPHLVPQIMNRWFSAPNVYYLFPLPLVTALVIVGSWLALKKRYDWLPFAGSASIFFLFYLGFALSVWPYIIPYNTTLWQAAAPKSSLVFLLVGTSILLPLLCAYTFYSYRVFRGKVTIDSLHA